MAQMFFGQFLLDEEVIDVECLQNALELADKDHHQIGALAVEWGYLSELQVELIQLEQRSNDRLFGELAIDMELLDRAQTAQLLEVQKSRHKPIGEALVELGVIDDTVGAPAAAVAVISSAKRTSQTTLVRSTNNRQRLCLIGSGGLSQKRRRPAPTPVAGPQGSMTRARASDRGQR